MKTLKITSVVDFKLKDRVEDILSKELFDITRNQGSRFSESQEIQNLDKANNYVNYQMDRLRAYAIAGDWPKFDYLADTLLKSSKSFLLYATNHVLETHPGMRTTKIIKIMEGVIKACREEKNNLNYKRVWIDKKPGDYGRPLGVPEVIDRIHDHMMTRIIEAYLCGTDQYSNDQHGGTPGRGTLTFITELAERLKTADRVYEFDIKGYFDHIKHESILEMFESKVILDYLVGILKSKPSEYPNIKDIDHPVDMFDTLDMRAIKSSIVYPFKTQKEAEAFLENTLKKAAKGRNYDDVTSWEIYEEEDFLETGEIWHLKEKTHTKTNYEDAYPWYMKNEPGISYSFGSTIKNENSEALGRDAWKDLHLENQGIPQGSSIGPVLSSILLGKLLKPFNGLYYMDDGCIFLKGKETGKEDWNRLMNERLASIGCEISPEKSRTLRSLDLMTQGLKIVGTRWTQVRQFFNYTVSTETRAGIKRKLFPDIKDNYLQILIDLHNKGHISPSKHRMLRWYLDSNNTLKAIRESDLFKVSEKIGILGNILQRAYSPTTTLEEMKEQIEYGIFKANLKMASATGSLGERLLAHSKKIIVETTEGRAEVKPTIFNVRALTNDVLLRYFKRELPVRSLRVQGLRKLREPDSSCTKRGKRSAVKPGDK